MLAECLKTATADAHRHAESRTLQRLLLRGELDAPRLGRYLAQLHRIHAMLERLFDCQPQVAALIGWSDAHRHSHRLECDLAALGAAPNAFFPTPATGHLFNMIDASAHAEPLALLGHFYVLEGSMNGNRFIVRALRRSPAASRCSFAYFDPYGPAQPATWTTFKAALDGVLPNAAQMQAIVSAALCMFDAIARISDEVLAEVKDQEPAVRGEESEVSDPQSVLEVTPGQSVRQALAAADL